jgi:hypothetical protein
MATLPKVLINRADYQIGGRVALRLRTQGPARSEDNSPHGRLSFGSTLERGRLG